MIYSMGVENPGAIVLHNYPRALQRHRRIDGELMDLATMDVLRDRERGVPRYNDFREEMRMPRRALVRRAQPNKPEWAEEIRRVYKNDIDAVDLQVGMYAEPLPPGFGFSDTAFRVFILMASRRLKSDRFFTTDFTPEVYTQTGIDWVNNTKMKDVILRHYPELEPALDGLPNAFLPWHKVDGSVRRGGSRSGSRARRRRWPRSTMTDDQGLPKASLVESAALRPRGAAAAVWCAGCSRRGRGRSSC